MTTKKNKKKEEKKKDDEIHDKESEECTLIANELEEHRQERGAEEK